MSVVCSVYRVYYIYEFLSIICTNIYKTSINTTSSILNVADRGTCPPHPHPLDRLCVSFRQRQWRPPTSVTRIVSLAPVASVWTPLCSRNLTLKCHRFRRSRNLSFSGAAPSCTPLFQRQWRHWQCQYGLHMYGCGSCLPDHGCGARAGDGRRVPDSGQSRPVRRDAPGSRDAQLHRPLVLVRDVRDDIHHDDAHVQHVHPPGVCAVPGVCADYHVSQSSRRNVTPWRPVWASSSLRKSNRELCWV